ncbi:aspartate dehydrogenase domain-containing protein [Nanoarchaeota archaeon]
MRIGLIGCGVIGSSIAKFLDKKGVRINFVSDIDAIQTLRLASELKSKPLIKSINDTIKLSDFIIEAATPKIVPKIMKLGKGKKIFIMSVGGLLGQKISKNIHFPSGAIGGLDALRAASVGKIKSVTLTTTKPPKGLKGAPYVVNKKINLDKITKKVIFSGSVKDAVKGFPKNVNVAASIAISSGVPRKVKVKIVVDKNIKRNIHEIEVMGDAGRFYVKAENVPSSVNPKTSQLAVYSALSSIKMLVEKQ